MARILIIDDETGVCEEFSEILKEDGYEVDTATSPHEGIEKIRNQSYDLVFLDVLMPRMEGREVLEEIRKICPTPVIIMSGYLPSDKEKDVIRSGAFASLRKPLDLKQVYSLIDKALQAKQD